MEITHEGEGVTVLAGLIADQAALARLAGSDPRPWLALAVTAAAGRPRPVGGIALLMG